MGGKRITRALTRSPEQTSHLAHYFCRTVPQQAITLTNRQILSLTHIDTWTNEQDTWTDEESYINIDDQNDCMFLKLKRHRNDVRLVFQRKFDTCDPQDYTIEVSIGLSFHTYCELSSRRTRIRCTNECFRGLEELGSEL